MKLFIRLSFVMLAAVLLSSCSKVVVTISDPVSGSWVLTDASGKDAGGWYSINTGLESGVFDFYPDGSALYSDNSVTLRGSWHTSISISGYYDESGNYYTDSHKTMTVRLSDSYGNSADMYFDDIRVSGGYMTGTVYDGHTLEKYHFSAY
jgi:hypothetical protein